MGKPQPIDAENSAPALDAGNSAPALNWKDEIVKVIWNGGSSWDAWFTATTCQMAQVLLTLPYSFAQMGLASGIVFQLLYAFMGCWSSYMTVWLYADYRHRKETIEKISFKNHHIQYFEILDGLLGTPWKIATLSFSVIFLFLTATIQIIACGSTAYYINDNLDKRTWTLILGSGCIISALIPTTQNYRVLSSVGIIMTTYTAWYMTIASTMHGQSQDVRHTGPHSYTDYYAGATNILFTFGGHAVTVEIMHPMRNPTKFKWVYLCAILYILTLTLPSAISVYWAYGDALLNRSNAFAVLPKTKYRDIAAVLMLMHQFIEFGMLAMPNNLLWEKMVGVHHQKSRLLRLASRIPVILAMWFLALMVPFCGAINSEVGAVFASVPVYIIPCIAHILYFKDPLARKNTIEKLPYWMPTWIGIYCINLGVVIWVTIVAVGLGSWGSTKNFIKQIHTFGLFTKCYQCGS